MLHSVSTALSLHLVVRRSHMPANVKVLLADKLCPDPRRILGRHPLKFFLNLF